MMSRREPMSLSTDEMAQRLELHLCREFVGQYLNLALRGRRMAVIDPSRIYMAARFSGLRISLSTLEAVLAEYRRKPNMTRRSYSDKSSINPA